MCKDYLLCFLSNRYHHGENMQDICSWLNKQVLNILDVKIIINIEYLDTYYTNIDEIDI